MSQQLAESYAPLATPRLGGASSQQVRTPLSLVPAGPARRRIPFAVFSMLALVGALVTVLMLNISVSSSQYELVDLRNQQIALSQENQALTQQMEDLQAPQNLAAEARELGMVASPGFGAIDVDSMKIAGTPEAATKGGEPLALIAAPDVSTTSGAAAGAPAADASAGDAPPAPVADEAPAEAEEPVIQSEQPQAIELNGGSIPAPQQGTGG
ncbi:hypothetical protein [Arthrobacter sp. CAN_C5]|uniref:hypothetical protein n=1 Tax=Arthrobacter sp. CAN_C5 TaxID=2760706 RepID=UPI001AEB9015|nr:hypothetical protein [Arthrobacter sp. CAN_C5]MBP2217403.1 cell division protein FtsB [Arthrobacter sp. CAN_C5]